MTSFVKLHGNGNDFVLVDETGGEVVNDKSGFALKWCDRRKGVGADGILFLSRSTVSDFRMGIFNPDGSEAEMCGNGIRCLVKYANDIEMFAGDSCTVETKAGILTVECRKGKPDGKTLVKVDMGVPTFKRSDLGIDGEGEFLEEELEGLTITVVNTGVPHAVIFVEEVDKEDITGIGPAVRSNSTFKYGTNVNLVQIEEEKLVIRTYERGVEKETLSCGTGATASAAAARYLNKLPLDQVRVQTKGGDLIISFMDGHAFMEGPAETVFKGILL